MQGGTSPVVETSVMTFAEAAAAIVSGKKVRRQTWPEEDAIFLHASVLHIRNAKGLHVLQVSEGDLLGTDWVEVTEN